MPVVGSGGASTTANDLIEETKRLLYSGHREQVNRLATAASANTTELTFDYELKGIQAGSVVAVDLELFYVWEVNEEAKSATVQAGWLGSTPAGHDDGAVVVVNPKFSDFAILKAINAELADLSSPNNGLFQIKTVEFTYSAATYGYDLTSATDVIEITEVRYESVYGNEWPIVRHWTPIANASTADFASGHGVVINDAVPPGRSVRVSYKAPFGSLGGGDDNVEDVTGLPPTAHDIPPLGAAFRLAAPREVMRNFVEAQGDSRRAEEVPAGANLNAVRGLVGLRESRIQAEAARLAAAWPIRRRGAGV